MPTSCSPGASFSSGAAVLPVVAPKLTLRANAAVHFVAPADGYLLLAACVCRASSLLASRWAGVSGRDAAPPVVCHSH